MDKGWAPKPLPGPKPRRNRPFQGSPLATSQAEFIPRPPHAAPPPSGLIGFFQPNKRFGLCCPSRGSSFKWARDSAPEKVDVRHQRLKGIRNGHIQPAGFGLVEHLVCGIVDNPEDVSVREKQGRGRPTLLKVSVHPDDLGRVIGRAGRTAKSLRTVVSALSGGRNIRVDFVDVNGR